MQLSFTRQKMLTSDFALQDWLPGEMDASPPGRSTPAGAGGRLPRTQARPAILLFLATSNDSELRVTEISGDMSHYTICGDLRRTAGLGRGLVILLAPSVVSSHADCQSRVVALCEMTQQPQCCGVMRGAGTAHPQSRSNKQPTPAGIHSLTVTSKGKEIKAMKFYNIGCWMIFKSRTLYYLFVLWKFLLTCCSQGTCKWEYSIRPSAQLKVETF